MQKILLALMVLGALDTWEVNAAEGVVSENGRCKDIFEAIYKGNPPEVQRFVEKENVDINNVTEFGIFPLTLAAEMGYTEIVRYLCSKKADPEVKSKNNPRFWSDTARPGGFTPIFYAASYGHIDVVKCLAEEFYANPNAKNGSGETPLFYAARSGNLEMVKYLYKNFNSDVETETDRKETPIFYAVRSGDLEVVKYFCENCNSSVNHVDSVGDTAITFAPTDEIREYLEQKLQEQQCAMRNQTVPSTSSCEQQYVPESQPDADDGTFD